MTTSLGFPSPVQLTAVAADNLAAVTPALEELYRGFEKELLIPLWTEIGDLMPLHPPVQGGATDSDSGALDLFRFSDSPVFEALKLNRSGPGVAR